MKYIRNDSLDPRYNLALEEWCWKICATTFISLWRNDNSIIIGRNQNTAEETTRPMWTNTRYVVRRPTGGGRFITIRESELSIIDAANADINFRTVYAAGFARIGNHGRACRTGYATIS